LVAHERSDAPLRSRAGGAGMTREETIDHTPQLGGRERAPQEVAYVGPEQFDEGGALRLPVIQTVRQKRGGDSRVGYERLQILRQRGDVRRLTIDLNQDEIRLTAPRRLERVAVRIDEVDGSLPIRDARQRASEFILECR